MDPIPKQRNINSNRSLTLRIETQKISSLLQNKPTAFVTDDMQYNHKISIDQVIEFKLRAQKKRLSAKLTIGEPKVKEEAKFSDEFYESIENFLDKHGMFIVDATPCRSPKNYSKLNKPPNSNDNSPFENEPLTACSVKIPKLSKFAQACEMHSPADYSKDPQSADIQKKSFLGKICTSSLLNRRKKFEPSD